MQAYEGYLEDGRFFPFGKEPNLVGRQKVIMTVIGDADKELLWHAERMLFAELEKGRKSADEKGWYTADEVDTMLADI
jgi:hypothetical protein